MGSPVPGQRVVVQVSIPGLELKSENWHRQSHPGWLIAKQRDAEKRQTGLILLSVRRMLDGLGPPFRVTITRVAPGTRPLDGDNLAGASKYTRDTIAKFLGIDDGDRGRIEFSTQQERGPWGVVLRIEGEERR